MRLLLLLCCCALALAIPAQAKEGNPFTSNDLLSFGMELAAADELLGAEKDWSVAYRVDTPSTAEVAALYRENIFFKALFFEGTCISLEKRAEVPPEVAEAAMQYYTELYGETPESTRSRDNSMLFGRWRLQDREIELTAHRRGGEGNYKLMYEEIDPLRVGEARQAQEREVSSQQTVGVDPITGQPRLIPNPPAEGETETGEPAPESDEETTSGDEQPSGDAENGDEEEAAPEDEGEDGNSGGGGKDSDGMRNRGDD